MKKASFTAILGLLAFISSAFAGNTNFDVSQRIQSSFSSKFSAASEVTWSSTDHYMKATFKMDGQFLSAYYSPKGELIGVARQISSRQLPLNLQSGVKKDFAASWISELFEFSTAEETIYMATIETADEKVTLKSSNGSSWSTVSKAKKP